MRRAFERATNKNVILRCPRTFCARPDPRVDRVIGGVGIGDWTAAEVAAIELIKQTEPEGRNELFEALLKYLDCDDDDDDMLWSAILTIECCVRLSPWLINRKLLSRMASHKNFSVRASAASICMDFANTFPDHVPVDLLLTLSVWNEDWYVQAPANAALKALVRSTPGVLQIFFARLGSNNKDERAHSANAIREIADEEPELLDVKELEKHLQRLRVVGDRDAVTYLDRAISNARKVTPLKRYRYGL